MPVYSMTGYATLQSKPANADAPPSPTVGIEIRSVNSRFLDLTFKLSDEMRGAEPALRELLGKELSRGKVEVRGWTEGRGDGVARQPTTAELQKLVSIQDGIRAWLPTAEPLSVAEVLGLTSRQAAATPVGLQVRDVRNTRALAFAESLGLQREGLMRKVERDARGQLCDQYLLARLSTDSVPTIADSRDSVATV